MRRIADEEPCEEWRERIEAGIATAQNVARIDLAVEEAIGTQWRGFARRVAWGLGNEGAQSSGGQMAQRLTRATPQHDPA